MPTISLVAGFISWQAVVMSHRFNLLLVPAPIEVVGAMEKIITSQIGIGHILGTLARAGVGLMVGTALGIISGVVMAIQRPVRQVAWGWVEFVRSIPAPALMPLSLLLWGVGELSKIILIIVIVALLMIVNTVSAIDNRSPLRQMVGLSLGFKKFELWRRVMLPEALPQLSTGFRLAISLALIITVVSEMVMGTSHGIGRAILDAELTYETPTMYAYIILAGLIGYGANAIYNYFEQKYIHWKGK